MVDKLSSNMDKSRGKVKQLKKDVGSVNEELEQTDKISNKLKGSIGKLASAFAIKELVSRITTVRGQFQQLEVAFTTMLQSAEKADALMQQLTRTAATTPFGLEDVAQGAKQLLAYGFEAEKVNETLIRLGDIAAGLSVPLNDLVYLYGTTMAQGRMYTQDLNQFTNRGIPMISELAKQFGVAESRVKELVEAGKVGFPEVQKVIENLTNEGGRFGGLMEEQSKTITGQISNIEDAISMMFNEIGQQSEGVISDTLSGVSYMIEHYERFGRILMGLVGVYGTYRTAIMLVAAAKGFATAAEALHYNWLLLVEKAQKALNSTMLKNPYILVATLIAGVVAAMVSMKSEAELLREADERYEAQKQKVIEAEEEHKRRLDELCSIAGDEALSTDTRREALHELEKKYPDIFAKYDTEIEKLKNIKKIKEEIAALEGQASITNPRNELNDANARIRELEAKKASGATRTVYNRSLGESYDVKLSGLTRAEEAELQNLYKKRDNLNDTIHKNNVNSYFENLTGISNDDLDKQIKQREDLLARMEIQKKKTGRISQGRQDLTGVFSKDELKYQLNKLREEQAERNAPRDSGSGWAAKAKKDYEKALKEYNDFIKDSSHKLTEGEFEKKRKELADNLDLKKKEYDKVKPSKNTDAENAEKQHQKELAERERRKQAQEKLGQELADLRRKNDAAEIAAMKEGAAKKLREIDNEYQAKKNAIDKQEADWKRENKKAGVATGDNGLTADQTAALKKARELNDQAAAAGRQSELDAARRAWEEYLAEYGSFEEKRQALQSLYAAKMEEAGYAGEKAALQKELDGKLKELNFDEFKAGIDFAEVFGNIDTQSSAALATLRDKLKEYISKAAKDLKPDDLKALREALTKIDLKITERNPFEGFKNDLGELKAAYEKVRQAQEDLNAVTDGAKVYVEEYDKETGKVVKKLLTQEQAERRLAQAQSERFTKMAEATQSLHAGVEKAREYGEAAEAVMDMLGELGVQLPEEIGGIVGGYGQALDGLASIDFTKPLSIVTGAIKSLTGLGKVAANVLTLGGIDFGGKKSIRRYEEAKAEYEKYMAVLDRVIAKQKELVASMDASDYLNADNSYNKAKEAIAKSEQAARNLGRQYLDSGASKGFLGIGSSASRGVSQRKDMSSAAWAEFNALKRQTDEMQKLGLSMQTMNDASTGRMKGLFDMNAKQLEWLQANAPTFWAQLHDDTRKYLEQIIACGDEWEEIEAARRESLTKMTFDEFYSSWLEKIKDMKSDVKDVADAMEEQFQNAILTSLMEKKYRQQLQNLYNQWADMTESGGGLDDAEIEALRKERDRIAAEAIRDRNELAETFGWKDETATAQSGKAGGFNAMSQDQGTKLEGLFVSGQIHWASIDDKLTDVATQMSIAGGTLLKIEENTGSNARSAAAILDEMKKMIRDGIKVK